MGIVKLKIRRTSEEGFLVILTATNRESETEGFLLPLPPELESSFTQWQSAYRQIEDVRSYIAPAPGMRLTPKGVKIHSNLEYTQAVKTHLNQWLNSGDNRWQPIRDGLIAIAEQLHSSGEEIRAYFGCKRYPSAPSSLARVESLGTTLSSSRNCFKYAEIDKSQAEHSLEPSFQS